MDKVRSSRDVMIRTEAWNEAVAFYEQTPGFTVSLRTGTMRGFETGSFCLYVGKGARQGPVFELRVADVAATRARLIAAGCTLIEEDPALPRCYLRDPHGLTFNLHRKS